MTIGFKDDSDHESDSEEEKDSGNGYSDVLAQSDSELKCGFTHAKPVNNVIFTSIGY